MVLEVDEFWTGSERVAAIYTEDPEPAGLALNPWLSKSEKRARILEAHGYMRGNSPPGGLERLCFLAFTLDDVDPAAVRAIRRVVDEMAPDWVFAVYCNLDSYEYAEYINPYEIQDEEDIPLQAVVAILYNLDGRGMLPPPDPDLIDPWMDP